MDGISIGRLSLQGNSWLTCVVVGEISTFEMMTLTVQYALAVQHSLKIIAVKLPSLHHHLFHSVIIGTSLIGIVCRVHASDSGPDTCMGFADPSPNPVDKR
jgi:hypothetical protein